MQRIRPIRTCISPPGFTLIELLVVISIIALLISIVLPVLSHARFNAREVICSNQVRQIVISQIGAAVDYRERFPVNNGGWMMYSQFTNNLGQDNTFQRLWLGGYITGYEHYICPIRDNAAGDDWDGYAPFIAPGGSYMNWSYAIAHPETPASIWTSYSWTPRFPKTVVDSSGQTVDVVQTSDLTSGTALVAHDLYEQAGWGVINYWHKNVGLVDDRPDATSPVGMGDGSVRIQRREDTSLRMVSAGRYCYW